MFGAEPASHGYGDAPLDGAETIATVFLAESTCCGCSTTPLDGAEPPSAMFAAESASNSEGGGRAFAFVVINRTAD